MRNYVKLLAVPALVLAAACGGNDEPRVDDALKSDLALAATAQPYPQQQYVSPMEMGYMGQQGYMPMQPQPYYGGAYGQPVYQPAPRPVVYRTAGTTTRRSTSARVPSGTIVKRNTKRDAVIGAVGGAVIGAATSRDRVKGGVIGAAAGAVLGGIIGHTVDVQRAP
jgi:hypothetical protein